MALLAWPCLPANRHPMRPAGMLVGQALAQPCCDQGGGLALRNPVAEGARASGDAKAADFVVQIVRQLFEVRGGVRGFAHFGRVVGAHPGNAPDMA